MNNQFTQNGREIAEVPAVENSAESSSQLLAESGFKRFSAACRRKFNALKAAITASLAAEFAGVPEETIRRVVNEADAIAAYTPFPALFLPALAEEKVLLASRWQARQQRIYERSLSLAA